jgi:hypothetical protein
MNYDAMLHLYRSTRLLVVFTLVLKAASVHTAPWQI